MVRKSLSEEEIAFWKDLGNKIRSRRENNGFSRKYVAKKLGMTHQQLTKYEIGENVISLTNLKKLAKVLDVPFSYFIADERDKLHPILNKYTIITIGKYNNLPRELQKIVDRIVLLLSTLKTVE